MLHNKNLPEEKRGDITSFSKASARNLRNWLLTMYQPEKIPLSATLTTQEIYTPERWREIVKRFRTSMNYKKISGVYRVELQKRKTPHLHCIFWVNKDSLENMNTIRNAWLQSVGENTWENQKYGVKFSAIHNEAGWYLYQTLHSSKHKKEQLGWIGKQWGIWCRSQFVERAPEVQELSQENYAVICRRLRRWSVTRVRGKKLRPLYVYNSNNSTLCIPPAVLDQLTRGLNLDVSHISDIEKICLKLKEA